MNKQQFLKIKDSIIKLKEGLGTRKTQFVLYGFSALLIIFILIFAYRPLMIKLRDADRELKSLEAQLLSQRSNIAALKNLSLKGRLMQQKEVSQAIDEMTEEGRTLGLKFASITPGELKKSAPDDFKKLPINFTIESEYQGLGQFLVYLEDSFDSIAEVESLSIRPREENSPKLNIELLVNLYMEAEDGEK